MRWVTGNMAADGKLEEAKAQCLVSVSSTSRRKSDRQRRLKQDPMHTVEARTQRKYDEDLFQENVTDEGVVRFHL